MKKLLVFAIILLLIGCRKEHRLPSSVEGDNDNPLQDLPKCGNEVNPEFTSKMKAAQAAYGEQEVVSRRNPKEGSNQEEEPNVIFLDTDGESVKHTIWNWLGTFNCPGSGLTAGQINLILQSVTEDFSPFQVIVTTDEKIYNRAKKAHRLRVIVTRLGALRHFFPTSGGVAFTGSFWWGNDTPCFVFADVFGGNAAHIAETVSHMAGHTFGLEHQAEYSFQGALITEFHRGFLSDPYNLLWKPIMGDPYNGDLSGWMAGRTLASNFNLAATQDDMEILGTLGIKADAVSPIIINSLSNAVSIKELINKPGDWDDYEVNHGDIKFSLQAGGNCDLRIVVYDQDHEVVGDFNDPDNLGISEKTINTNGNRVYLRVEANGLLIGDLFSQPQMAGQYTLHVNK